MSIHAHMARFSPQLTLDLPSSAPVAEGCKAVPLGRPTRDELVAAALANHDVRAFVEAGLPTWSEARVQRNPPCYLVYEHGEVVGNLEDLPLMARHAEKRSGFGRRHGLRPLRPDGPVLPYHLGIRRGPHRPRRVRYEQRMALKRLLARGDRGAVRQAMRRTRQDFLRWAAEHPGLAGRVADATGLALPAFWRAVRGDRAGRPAAMTRPHPPEKSGVGA